MQKLNRINIFAAVVFSSVAFGSLLSAQQATRADDVPIIVGKPIIKKDPPQPKKDVGLTLKDAWSGTGQS